MNILYNLMLYLAVPFAIARLYIKSRKNPAYRSRIAERFARALPAAAPHPLWIHTVSVGEFLAITPLLEEIRTRHPMLPLWLTCTTPTGRTQIARWAAQRHGICYSYFPYDTAAAVRRFYTHVRPCAAIFMETEIWPNTLLEAKRQGIPALLINARLSAKSLRGYKKYASKILSAPLTGLHINAQTRQDAKRFAVLAPQADISITPSLKYAAPAAAAQPLTDFLPENTAILLGASTHHGEEALFIKVWQTLRKIYPELILCLAPRHPERRADIVRLIEQSGHTAVLRSQGKILAYSSQIALLDTLGELARAYASASAAVIGGSFIEHGGHNPLEAMHQGTPVCFGGSMYNFASIAARITAEPFAIQTDRGQLAAAIGKLLTYHAQHGRQPILQYSRQQSADVLERHYRYVSAHTLASSF